MAEATASATGEELQVAVDGPVATITLDRPDALNALTVRLREGLLRAIRRADRDPAVRAIVLTGAGRAFCAGQDLKERLEPDAAALETELRDRYNPLVLAMRESDTPIVGAINGVAADTASSTVIITASALGIPVSTTHNVSASIMGVGFAKRANAIRWTIVERMVWAWILTIPIAGALAYAMVMGLKLVGWLS